MKHSSKKNSVLKLKFKIARLTHVAVNTLLFQPFFLVMLAGGSCKINKGSISCIRLNFSMPDIEGFSGFINTADTIIVCYYKDYVMYQMPVVHFNTNMAFDRNKDSREESLSKPMMTMRYLVHKRNENVGLVYGSFLGKATNKFRVDSFLSKTWIFGFRHMYEVDMENDTLVRRDRRNGFLIEVFRPKVKFDASFNDSAYYYYSKNLRNADFSFSKALDSSRNMKLFKIEVVYNENPKGANVYERSKKKFLFQMAEVPVQNEGDIRGLFERYMKETSE
jgi:hypothetical protein